MAGGLKGLVQKAQNKAVAQNNADVNVPYQQYLQQAQAAIPKLYAPAYADISRQFQPQFASARNYLAGNPAQANSGTGARLNRYLLQGAYGQLGNAMTGATANVQTGGLDLLQSLIKRRMEQRYQERLAKQQKGGIGGAIGGLLGGVGGAIGGPVLGAIGQKFGSKINPNAIYGG